MLCTGADWLYDLTEVRTAGTLTAITPANPFDGTENLATSTPGLTAGDHILLCRFWRSMPRRDGASTKASKQALPRLPFPIAAPANFAVAPGGAAGEIDLTWDAVAGATGFKIFRGTVSGTLTEITPATAFDGSETDYTDYRHGTRCRNRHTSIRFWRSMPRAREREPRKQSAAAPTIAAPANFAVATGDAAGEIDLTWDTVAGATGFMIFRGTESGMLFDATPTAGVMGTATSYTDFALTPGTTYIYQILAFNAAGNGARTAEMSATTIIPAPTGLMATASATAVEIALTWNAVPGADSYELYRRGQGGTLSPLTLSANRPTGTMFTDNFGLPSGQQFFYAVAAVIGGTTGAQSAEASDTTLDVPGVPASFAVAMSATSRANRSYMGCCYRSDWL